MGTETLFTPERLVNICELERTEGTFFVGCMFQDHGEQQQREGLERILSFEL